MAARNAARRPKSGFPNGLDVTPPEVRAEHKARWDGDENEPGARTADSPAWAA